MQKKKRESEQQRVCFGWFLYFSSFVRFVCLFFWPLAAPVLPRSLAFFAAPFFQHFNVLFCIILSFFLFCFFSFPLPLCSFPPRSFPHFAQSSSLCLVSPRLLLGPLWPPPLCLLPSTSTSSRSCQATPCWRITLLHSRTRTSTQPRCLRTSRGVMSTAQTFSPRA